MTPHQIKTLRKQLTGSITDHKEVRDYFATDGSVFTINPSAVIYPRQVEDVQIAARYAYEQAQAGKPFSLIGRGKGTDQSGGALGSGAMVVFPSSMNRIRRLTKDTVTVEPGLVYGALQRVLHTHGRFLPPYPSSVDYSTVGGAAANNTAGEKSFKYGATAAWIKRLKVVLDDGSLIETRRLSRREVARKKGLMTREGDLYRGIDGLLQDHSALIKETQPHTSKNAAGYRLAAVRGSGGSIDLTQLFIGAQGTLGLITEITFATAHFESRRTLVIASFDSLEKVGDSVLRLQKLQPSAMEVIDQYALSALQTAQPQLLEGIVAGELPKILLMVEFDNQSHVRQNLLGRRAERIMHKYTKTHRILASRQDQAKLWHIRHAAAAVVSLNHKIKKALPIIEDACVPVAKMDEFLEGVYKLLKKHKLESAVWGHAGDGNFHLQPFLDLSKAKDRKTVFKLMDEFYTLVIKLGGTTTGEHGDGLLRAPYLEKLYGREMYEVFKEVKQICDPHGIFNPDIKLGVTKKDLEPLLRDEYSMGHLYDHMPIC